MPWGSLDRQPGLLVAVHIYPSVHSNVSECKSFRSSALRNGYRWEYCVGVLEAYRESVLLESVRASLAGSCTASLYQLGLPFCWFSPNNKVFSHFIVFIAALGCHKPSTCDLSSLPISVSAIPVDLGSSLQVPASHFPEAEPVRDKKQKARVDCP